MMETIPQLEKWQKQVEDARDGAYADMGVAKRLLKHSLESAQEIERLKSILSVKHWERDCASCGIVDNAKCMGCEQDVKVYFNYVPRA